MRKSAEQVITPPDQHIVTAQEALEPLYERLEQETEAKLIEAALEAGWPADEAVTAIGRLRLHDALSIIAKDPR
jgi:hypothetical protein